MMREHYAPGARTGSAISGFARTLCDGACGHAPLCEALETGNNRPIRRDHMKIANAVRIVVVAVASWCGVVSLLDAQAPAGAPDVKTLANEYFTRRGAAPGRTPGVLATIEQATAESTWAEGFLNRLHAIVPDSLGHDDWITWAMLDADAGLLKDAAKYFWFDVPITPYNSPFRGVAGTFGTLALKTEAD